jgi:hypothetical protein
LTGEESLRDLRWRIGEEEKTLVALQCQIEEEQRRQTAIAKREVFARVQIGGQAS